MSAGAAQPNVSNLVRGLIVASLLLSHYNFDKYYRDNRATLSALAKAGKSALPPAVLNAKQNEEYPLTNAAFAVCVKVFQSKSHPPTIKRSGSAVTCPALALCFLSVWCGTSDTRFKQL